MLGIKGGLAVRGNKDEAKAGEITGLDVFSAFVLTMGT